VLERELREKEAEAARLARINNQGIQTSAVRASSKSIGAMTQEKPTALGVGNKINDIELNVLVDESIHEFKLNGLHGKTAKILDEKQLQDLLKHRRLHVNSEQRYKLIDSIMSSGSGPHIKVSGEEISIEPEYNNSRT
jgi:hypothetical protein